ncbi:MAG: putative non-ribosomal peptide synthetase [Gammaproteobacteria bacterium]|nr:putative non-ribosomal peptide synthetase [Gammaproteobacteria bacterium]
MEMYVKVSNSQESMSKIADVLGYCRNKGVRLWSENGQLHYKAPKGVLTQLEIERLRLSKDQIVALLERANDAKGVEPKLESCIRVGHAPTTFSQLAHWHRYQLSERRSLRQVASAMRLLGRLNIDALRKSLIEIVRRHDALRTRIVDVDGILTQEIANSADCALVADDLTIFPETHREREVLRLIEQHIVEPIDCATGPLFGVRLLMLCNNEHVLIIAMEHMISDAFSMNILLRDLFTAYRQASKGRAFSLPEIPVQYPDYAIWQRNTQKSWVEKHGAYWDRRLGGCQRVRFPADGSVTIDTRVGWGSVPLKVGSALKAELREWCRLRRTTLVMSVFTAYVGLMLRWCGESEAVIQYITDGRVSTKLENTIGSFATGLYLRIELHEGDSFLELMDRVTEEYCNAYQHADFSYMEAQVPRPEFTRNSCFNWVPQGPKSSPSDLDGSDDTITWSPVPFEHPILKTLERDTEPFILLYETDDDIVGGVSFPLNRFSSNIMERFARNCLVFIRALLGQPEQRVKDVLLE